jgi:YD repeat-containing protein
MYIGNSPVNNNFEMIKHNITGMKILLVPVSIFFALTARAQYYYDDMISTQEINAVMKTYVSNKVRTVSSTGVDGNGVRNTGFSEFQEVKENGKLLKKTAINNLDKTVTYYRFDNLGRVISITDSSAAAKTTATYQYDAAGRLSVMQNALSDSASEFNQTEIHKWIYNASGKPEKMWRIINGSDSLEIRFIPDEKGNPGEEITYRKAFEKDHVYYYFDDKNRVTDIVRYNKKVKKLLPDVILTYDDGDRVIQKMNSAPGDNFGKVVWVGYLIWRYIYNENGLKTKEALFDQDQKLTGKIEYKYTFGN